MTFAVLFGFREKDQARTCSEERTADNQLTDWIPFLSCKVLLNVFVQGINSNRPDKQQHNKTPNFFRAMLHVA
jgi:hypothetical protein